MTEPTPRTTSAAHDKGAAVTEPQRATHQHTYRLDVGTVYVEVMPAKREDVYETAESRQRVWRDFGCVRVTTYPYRGFQQPEYVTLRGRKYIIDHCYRWQPYDGGRFTYASHLYTKGYLNSDERPLDWKSPVHDKLRAVEEEALKRFVEENPDWEQLSVKLRIQSELDAAEREVERFKEQVQQAEVKADELRRQLNG